MIVTREKRLAQLSIYSLIAIMYAVLTYCTITQIFPGVTDLSNHAAVVEETWEQKGFLTFFRRIPYFAFHLVAYVAHGFGLDYLCAFALAGGLFNFITALIVFFIIDERLLASNSSQIITVFVSVICLFVTAIYCPVFSNEVYIGQGSPTIWHNPTYYAIKPVALLTLYLYLKVFLSKDNQRTTTSLVALAFLIFIGLFCKPSFFQVIFPACFIFSIGIALHRDQPKKFLTDNALVFLPAIFFAVIQFLILFFLPPVEGSNNGGGFALSLFGGWSLRSPCPAVSILLLISFPLFVMFFSKKTDLEKKETLFCALLLAVALLEALILVETGDRAGDGNFSWGLYITVFLCWVYSIIHFVNHTLVRRDNNVVVSFLGILLMVWHFVSGLYYCYLLNFTPAII